MRLFVRLKISQLQTLILTQIIHFPIPGVEGTMALLFLALVKGAFPCVALCFAFCLIETSLKKKRKKKKKKGVVINDV